MLKSEVGGAGQAWRKPIHRPGRGVISHSTVKFARKVKVASPNVDLADVLPLTLRSKSATLHVEVALQSISWHFLAGWGRQKLEFSTKASDHDTKQVGPARRSALLFA